MTYDAATMQAVLDAIPDVIFYKDIDGVYRLGNKAWGELVGRPVDTLLGKNDFELFPLEVAKILSREGHRDDARSSEQG